MGASVRYTDRDVRENHELIAAAENYLESYQGEFAFLLDCKMRMANSIDLSVGMVRGILNCMRVDPRVNYLPEPMEFEADLIPFPERGNVVTRRRLPLARVMEIARPRELRNGGHYMYRLPATVHDEYMFVKGRSAATLTVHLVVEAEVEWHPHRFVDQSGWSRPPQLIVKTNCKYPYSLRNPLLLTVDHVSSNDMLVRCQYCYYEA